MGKNSGLKQSVMSGLAWAFAERLCAQGVSFIVSIVLARILLPEEYGIIAVVTIFITIANVFVSNGFGEALVQKKDSDEIDFSTVFFCSLLFSAILYSVLFICASFIADFYSTPQLKIVIRVLALKIPISAVSTIQHAYVSKKMIFKKFFFSTLGGTVFSGILGVIMAIAGCGVWALVAQYLSNTLIDTIVLFITVPWRPKLIFSSSSAKKLIGYSWKITAASLINTLFNELRGIVIGKVYSPADLAYYNRGNQFPSLVITNINASISKVVFPALTKVADNRERLKAVSRRGMKITAFVIFPLMIGLMVEAETVVKLLLTEKWIECVPFLQCHCLYYMCQPIQTANWEIIKASGRSDLCLKLEIIKKPLGVIVILATMKYGVMAIAIGNAVFAGVSMIINIIPNKKLVGYKFTEQMKDILPALSLCAVMGATLLMLHRFLSVGMLIQLVIDVIVGIIIYCGGAKVIKLDTFDYIIDAARSILRKR